MSSKVAQHPSQVWDGSSSSRPADPSLNRQPDYQDWDQMAAELKAVQAGHLMVVPNAVGAAVVVGKAVYLLANGTGAALADANGTAPARNVMGLVSVGAPGSGGNVTVLEEGELTLTTAQWDAVAGTTGGLAAFTEYYLSGTPGAITATVPATTGDTDIVVGIAKSATVMHVRVRHVLSSHA